MDGRSSDDDVHVKRTGDLLYAALFGVLVALGVSIAIGELLRAISARGTSLAGWEAFGVAVAVCAGIAAGKGVRWHRKRAVR